jgi:hypothetical protein
MCSVTSLVIFIFISTEFLVKWISWFGKRTTCLNSCSGQYSTPTTNKCVFCCLLHKASWGTWGTVSDYRLDDWSSIPGWGKEFFRSLCVQTSSEACPASYPVGNWGLFTGVKRGRDVTLTTHPHLVPRSRMSRSYILSPLEHVWR